MLRSFECSYFGVAKQDNKTYTTSQTSPTNVVIKEKIRIKMVVTVLIRSIRNNETNMLFQQKQQQLSLLLLLFLVTVQNNSFINNSTVEAFTVQHKNNNYINNNNKQSLSQQQQQQQQQQKLEGRYMMCLRYKCSSTSNYDINHNDCYSYSCHHSCSSSTRRKTTKLQSIVRKDENIIDKNEHNNDNDHDNDNNQIGCTGSNVFDTSTNNMYTTENDNDKNVYNKFNTIIQRSKSRRNVLETLLVPAATGFVSSSFIDSSSYQSYAAASTILSTTTTTTTTTTTKDSPIITSTSTSTQKVLPISPYVTISTQQYDKNNVLRTVQRKLPRVGYSSYKTTTDNIENGIITALQAGVRHFDIGTDYNTNSIIGTIIQEYINTGLGIDTSTNNESDDTARRRRRNEIYITHKLSNNEQSIDSTSIQNSIQSTYEQLFGSIDYPISTSTTSKTRNANKKFQKNYIDVVLLHSPLTNQNKRLTTYETLINMQRQYNNPLIGLVGVCHYSVDALNEIIYNNLPPPSIIQLVLSPFNQHIDIQQWIKQHSSSDKTIVSCSAWSKLSSTSGPIVGWTTLSDIAKRTNRTNAQVLISWSIQNNFICVPRSNANYKIEKQNIYENTFLETIQNKSPLSSQDMKLLNSLNEQYPVCRLGITDGWTEQQILNSNTWDPTTAPLII